MSGLKDHIAEMMNQWPDGVSADVIMADLRERFRLRGSLAVSPKASEGLPPWGDWFVLDSQEDFKVKRIEVSPGKRLSFQRHFRREEHWQIMRGQARVTINGQDFLLGEGECIRVAREALHRIENIGQGLLIFIEVQRGDYFGEDDIERVEDDYNRT
jgi:mannose-6-phosphate isomerase-like protein (cupin superfamily)